MSRWMLAVAFLLVFGIALAACNSSGTDTTFGNGGPCPDKTPPSAQGDADMSVEELTDLVAEAITCPGYAFHMRSAGDTKSGPYSSYSETEAWIDMQRGVGRSDQLYRFTSDEAIAEAERPQPEAEEDAFELESKTTGIIRGDVSYGSPRSGRPAGKGRSPGCHGPGREVLSAVLQCYDGPLQYFEVSIDPNASYNGQSAIAYVADGESSGSDETYFTTTRTFFNAVTFLPMGQVIEGTLDIGETYPIQADFVYEHEFVPLDSLADDFFDPASIGYVEPDPGDVEKPLNDAEIAVYWIGRDFEGNDEYPPLAIRHAVARPRAQTSERGFIAQIAYRDAEDEFGNIWVRVELYTPEAWKFREQDTLENPCEEIVELDLPGSSATIRNRGGQRSDGTCNPQNGFIAVVQFEDVVVDIDAPTTNSGRQAFRSPYDTEAAMELLVRSLELRE